MFATSRLLDYLSEKELVKQCGHPRKHWPLVVVKELLDNALDACEEQGIAPEIELTIDESGIAVADSGAGIPEEIIDLVLDFSLRVSSREAYVAPDRGAQGNALKVLIAMPLVLDGSEGRIDITGGGVHNEIVLSVDRIAQQPRAEVQRSVRTGSRVHLHWPLGASSEPDEPFESLQGELLDLVVGFSTMNPHLTLSYDINGRARTIEATDPAWRKWTPSSPTCPHWYRLDDIERLIGAYLTHDAQHDGGRTVRDFLAEFKGLTSTVKQKKVLSELGLARVPLSALANGDDLDHVRVARLLAAMRTYTRPVKPAALGVIGEDHIRARIEEHGIRPGSFDYRKKLSLGEDGLPQVTEIAFAALDRDIEPFDYVLEGVVG